jgi:hypothetical protein
MNTLERKAYDMERTMEYKNKNFKEAKAGFEEFIKLQEQSSTEENKAIAKLNFEQGLANMDRKHGINRKDMEYIPSKEESDRRMEDMRLQREQEDIELQQENPFEGREFNQSEFNKLFLKKQKRDEKRKKQSGGLAKVNDGIAAFNDFDGESGGIGIDQMDNLYSDDKFADYNANYAGVGAGMIGRNVDNDLASDDISIDSPDEDEYDIESHKKGISKDAFEAAMKKMESEREENDKIFEQFQEKNEYVSALDDKYGISSQLGFMVGTDKFGNQKNNKKRVAEKDEMRAYKKLTQK